MLSVTTSCRVVLLVSLRFGFAGRGGGLVLVLVLSLSSILLGYYTTGTTNLIRVKFDVDVDYGLLIV